MTEDRVVRLRCEHLVDPRGVDRLRPRLSWQVRSARRGAEQTGYRLLAASAPELLHEGTADVWDSGRIASTDCVLVPYGGPPLASRQQVFWSVRAWNEQDESTPYAEQASFEMGLLEPSDWVAQWVAPPTTEPSAVTYLRSALRLDAPALRARAYVTALGLYDLHCNGQRVGDARFTPGWTDYARRIQYQVLDLTDLLVVGANLLEARLADGWYAGYIGFQGTRAHYGDAPQLLAQIEVDTASGRVVHATGEQWLAGRGPIRSSDMLKGEVFDGDPLASDDPQSVRITAGTPARRVTSPAPPVRVLEERPAVTITRSGDVHRVDFGQNLVGWVRLRLSGAAGAAVSVRHAEILQPDGSLYLENLRTASATDTYLLGSDDEYLLEPAFTFHGFRYAEVCGYAPDLRPEDVTAIVCGSDLERVGDFDCSDDGVNQLHSNIVWSARGNFFDIPTDCPQRDERMGWTGDAQVFAPTACYLFDTAAFFTKWLRDMTDAQSPDGSFPDVVPLVVLAPEGSAAWADAGVIVPTVLSERYADDALLAELYPAMRRWVDYVHAANPNLLWLAARGYDNGDWLAAHAETDKDLIATAYFARSTRLTARTADGLGRRDDGEQLHALADRITAAWREAFLLADGRLKCETQTAYALALRFGLLPRDAEQAASAHLAANVEAHDMHLTTGFLGVGQLLPALTEGGHTPFAYRLLLRDEYPSWLHAVRAGATTIWERWDGWTAESGYGDPAMNSYNHYALGSVGEWLYGYAAGIRYDAPGGRRLLLAPLPADALRWARASHLSPYGVVRSGWERTDDGTLRVDVEVPVGSHATLRLPATQAAVVREGGELLDLPVGGRSSEDVVVELVSGAYSFTVCEPADQPATQGSSHVS